MRGGGREGGRERETDQILKEICLQEKFWRAFCVQSSKMSRSTFFIPFANEGGQKGRHRQGAFEKDLMRTCACLRAGNHM